MIKIAHDIKTLLDKNHFLLAHALTHIKL